MSTAAKGTQVPFKRTRNHLFSAPGWVTAALCLARWSGVQSDDSLDELFRQKVILKCLSPLRQGLFTQFYICQRRNIHASEGAAEGIHSVHSHMETRPTWSSSHHFYYLTWQAQAAVNTSADSWVQGKINSSSSQVRLPIGSFSNIILQLFPKSWVPWLSLARF